MTAGLPLMKNLHTPLAKNILVSLGLTAAGLATNAAIQKKFFGSGTAILVFSNEEFNDIMKIVKSLEDPNLLIKGVSKTAENEINKQRRELLGILGATLGVSLLGNMLASRGMKYKISEHEDTIHRLGVIQACEGTIRAGEGTIRAGQDNTTVLSK